MKFFSNKLGIVRPGLVRVVIMDSEIFCYTKSWRLLIGHRR